MKVSNEIKVGVLSVCSIIILIVGYKFLKGKDLFQNSNFFYAQYSNINGLSENSQVVLNGLKIGKVQKLSFGKNHSIITKMSINKDLKIPIGSQAQIISADLLGTKEISIIFSKEDSFAISGDTLFGTVESNLQDQVSATILPVQQKAQELLGSMDTMVQVIGLIFNENNRKNIDSSLYSFTNALETMSNTAEQIDTIVSNEKLRINEIITKVQSIASNFESNNRVIKDLLKNIESISDSIQQAEIKRTINNTRKALYEFAIITEKINKGEGSLSMLINDKDLYNNLAKSSASLDSLLSDLKNNPNRYVHFSVFGKKGKKKKSRKEKKWD